LCSTGKELLWDKEAGKAHESGGLFGKAVAYTAGVETQGGGALHFHALITLEDFRATHDEEKRWERGSKNAEGPKQFQNEYCAYANALASAVYPKYQPFLGNDAMTKSMHGDTTTKGEFLHCPLCSTGKLQSKDIKSAHASSPSHCAIITNSLHKNSGISWTIRIKRFEQPDSSAPL